MKKHLKSPQAIILTLIVATVTAAFVVNLILGVGVVFSWIGGLMISMCVKVASEATSKDL